AGAKAGAATTDAVVNPQPAASIRAALARSLPLLQRTDVLFMQKAGCVSCHNNTYTAMTIATARQGGFAVDEQIARSQMKKIGAYIETWRERALQGVGIPGESKSISSILLGLAFETYLPDAATDALARFVE